MSSTRAWRENRQRQWYRGTHEEGRLPAPARRFWRHPSRATSLSPKSSPAAATVLIQVHAAQPTGPYTPIWNFFGADEPNYLYAPNGKKTLGELAALSPVPVYFRPTTSSPPANGDASPQVGFDQHLH